MTRLALRGLAARKLRTSLTVIAVLLGVTMIAGTFVLTDTIQKAFDDIFTSQTKGADVVVTGKTKVKSDFSQPRPLDEAVLAQIKQIPDVTQVAGQINDTAAVVGKDGKIVKTGGAPTIAATYMPPPFKAVTISQGRAPAGPDEIALDAGTADKEDFKVGDEVTVATAQPKRKFKLVGLASLGNATSFGGATVVIFDLKTAQQLFQKPGQVDFAYVAGKPGVSPDALKRQIASILPPTAQVRTALGGGRQARRGHPPGPLVPHHRPARVRVHRRAGGRLPDLQHVLDHRRPARPRARAAAHARRHPAPGADLGDARGADDRASSARWSASSPASASRRRSTRSSRRSASTCRRPASCSSRGR